MIKFYNSLPTYGKVIFWVIVAIIIFYLWKKLSIYLQGLKVHTLSGSQVTYNGTQIDLGGKALTIYNALHNYYGGAFEDETTAENAVISVPNIYIKQLSSLYWTLYAKDLKQDLIDYCDWDKLSYKFI